ncbi:MAG: aldo/keto reductase [Candidatus Eisenbacteria bacterium]
MNAFLERIKPIAASHRATLAQVVIHWTIRRPGISAVLVGARNPDQAEENAPGADLALSREELDTMSRTNGRRAARRLPHAGATAVRAAGLAWISGPG